MIAVMHPCGEALAKPFEAHRIANERGKLADYLKSLNGQARGVPAHTGRYDQPTARYQPDGLADSCRAFTSRMRENGLEILNSIRRHVISTAGCLAALA